MRILALTIVLAAHLAFIGASSFAFFGFMNPESWGGFFYVVITSVFGFPWSIALWVSSSSGPTKPTDSAALWLGVIANYALLWWITVKAFQRAFVGSAKEDTHGAPTGISISAKAGWGIFFPVVFSAGLLGLWFHSLDDRGREYGGLLFLHFSVAALPALGVANLWILPIPFRTRGRVLTAGFALPLATVLALMVSLWAASITRAPQWLGWFIALLFFLPLLYSMFYSLRRSQAKPDGARKQTT
jgi:hypothetical protein